MTLRRLLPSLCALTVSAGCGGKEHRVQTPAHRPDHDLDDGCTATERADRKGEGTVVLVGHGAVQDLVLTPYAPDGTAAAPVKPSAEGRVKAGIYQVPGGSWTRTAASFPVCSMIRRRRRASSRTGTGRRSDGIPGRLRLGAARQEA